MYINLGVVNIAWKLYLNRGSSFSHKRLFKMYLIDICIICFPVVHLLSTGQVSRMEGC